MDVASCSSTTYEVFLSFRGPDVRKNFADFLYRGLKDAGISVCRDEEDLPLGEPIHPELARAIKRSKISMPIFSSDYASSKSCLMEVQQMLDCQEAGDHTILPIFFDVGPSIVKYQTGTFGDSFIHHERNGVDPETISRWKCALGKIGHLKGWDVLNGYQSDVIEHIVSAACGILKKAQLRLPNHLVGLDNHVEEVMRRLDVASDDVRSIVIHGIGGVGKTTLAKVVYNQLCRLFDACSHVDNIREVSKEMSGLRRLQKQLVSKLLNKKLHKFDCLDDGVRFMRLKFSNRKVLILLDDLDNCEQLEFVGELNQFGPGSRIILTTRKADILNDVEKYEVQCMNAEQALRLFCKHAFRMDMPRAGYNHLSREIVSAVKALPLALEVIGRRLFGEGEDIWEGTLHRLKQRPEVDVEEKLMISYESLRDDEKEIFLDIACFFIGKDQRIARYMWGDHAPVSIKTLISRSLVKIGDNSELRMHDLLRDLGREIVRRENPDEPGKRSRLWHHGDAISTLRNREGTRNVRGLGLSFDDESKIYFSPGDFYPLSNLRFLKLDLANIEGEYRNRLFPTLMWLDWEGCSRMADLLNWNLDKLAILNLSGSQITGEIDTWTEIVKSAGKLKVLDLRGCLNLSGCLKFPAPMPLKVLVLEDCCRLRQIDPSISHLHELESLNLKMCCEVANLPSQLSFMKGLKELLIDGTSISTLHFPEGSMKRLETLSARGCKRLKEITDSIGGLKSLMHLVLDDAIIAKLPSSIGSLAKLASLSLRNCQNLLELPDSIGGLESLSGIDLTNTRVDELPISFKHLVKLKVLKMEGCFIREFPVAIAGLKNLEEINFSFCRSLAGEVPKGISTTVIILRLSHTKICSLPAPVLGPHLQILDLRECKKLQALPDLPSSLVTLYAGSDGLNVVPNLSHLVKLKELHLGIDAKGNDSSLTRAFGSVSRLLKLETLELSFSNHFKLLLPENFASLSQLRKLTLKFVDLRHLSQLPSSLSRLSLQNCRSSSDSPDLSNIHGLLELELKDCEMDEIHGLHHLEALQVLKVSYCSVRTLDALDELQHLRKLTIFHCRYLKRLPDLSHFKKLHEKDIEFWDR